MPELDKKLERKPVTGFAVDKHVLVPVMLMDSDGNPAGRVVVRLATESLSPAIKQEMDVLVKEQLQK